MNKKEYISYKIKKLKEEDYKSSQASAIAFSYADKKYQFGGGVDNYNVQNYFDTNSQQYLGFPYGAFQIPDQQPSSSMFGSLPYRASIAPQNNNIEPQPINFRNDINQTQPPSTEPSLGTYAQNNPVYDPLKDPQYRAKQDRMITDSNTGINNDINNNQVNYQTTINRRLYNPYGGVSLENALFSLGQSLNYSGDQNTANTIKGVSAAGKVLLGGARTVLSGAGYQNANQNAYADYVDRLFGNSPAFTYLQQGGEVTNADVLTGAYVTEMPVGNVEIEDGEQVMRPDGQVQQAVGEDHENGGVKTQLEQGSKVLSDYTKIGSQKAKLFRKEFDIKTKASDTYADVMDKYNKKIGWNKLIDDEAKTIEEIENQEKSSIAKDTRDINQSFLSEKMQEINHEKEELNVKQQEAFEKIFKEQEKSPKKKDNEKMQQGGTVYVSDKSDPRYKAYLDSLKIYNNNKYTSDQYAINPDSFSRGRDLQLDPYFKDTYSSDKIKPVGLSSGDGSEAYMKPNQQVIIGDPTPQVTAINAQSLQNAPTGISVNTIEQRQYQPEIPTYGQDRFQNMWLAQGKIPTTEERRANPEWDKDVQIMYLRPPEELNLQRENNGFYAKYNNSYNNLVEGRDFVYMRGGGEVEALAQKHGISPERMFELMKMQQGGRFYTPSTFALSEYGNQPYGSAQYLAGNVSTPEIAAERLRQQANLLPYTLTRSGLLVDNNPVLDNAEAIRNFQQNYNQYVNAVVQNIDANPNLTQEQKDQLKQQAINEGFVNEAGSVRSMDAILGNFTSSRGAFGLPYLTEQDLQKYPNIQRIGDVIDAQGNIKPEYAELDPQTVEALKQTVQLSGENALDIAVLPIPQAEVPAQPSPVETPQETINQTVTQYSIPNLPQEFILPPSALQLPLKSDVTLGRIEPVKISAEPNLIEADRQRQAAFNAVNSLPDSQRAAALGNILAQTQSTTNQAITQAEQANAQAQYQADLYNVQQQDKQQLLNEQFNQTYQQQAFAAMTNTNRDIADYFQQQNLIQQRNYADVRDLNLINQLYPNYQTTGTDVYFNNAPLNFNVGNSAAASMLANYNNLSQADKLKVQADLAKKAAKKR